MASPKNWDRMRSSEMGDVLYYWGHTTNAGVSVREFADQQYTVRLKGLPSEYRHYTAERLGRFDSKEEARKFAVEWMRNHQRPLDYLRQN